jgi:hypothetical protein
MVLAEQSASVATILSLKPLRPPSSELLKLSFGLQITHACYVMA